MSFYRAPALIVAGAALVASCSAAPAEHERQSTAPEPPASPAARTPAAADAAPAALTPVSEAPFRDTSAQGAADVVQTYFALIEKRKYDDAALLWNDRGSADGMSAEEFAASFAQYRDYHAEVFAPGDTEGGAGSIYIDVPARIYGARTSGAKLDRTVTVSLRRVNDVDGATPAQLRWHIIQIADSPAATAAAL